jgi:hypothetical protein
MKTKIIDGKKYVLCPKCRVFVPYEKIKNGSHKKDCLEYQKTLKAREKAEKVCREILNKLLR